MATKMTVGDFLDHIDELAIDNPQILDMTLDGLYIYPNGLDAIPKVIAVLEDSADETHA